MYGDAHSPETIECSRPAGGRDASDDALSGKFSPDILTSFKVWSDPVHAN